MTPPELFAGAASAATVIGLLGGAIYYRGRRDGRTDERDKRGDRDSEDGREVRDRVLVLEAELSSHKDECLRVAQANQRALERLESTVDRRFNELAAQIANVARGQAGKFEQVTLRDEGS